MSRWPRQWRPLEHRCGSEPRRSEDLLGQNLLKPWCQKSQRTLLPHLQAVVLAVDGDEFLVAKHFQEDDSDWPQIRGIEEPSGGSNVWRCQSKIMFCTWGKIHPLLKLTSPTKESYKENEYTGNSNYMIHKSHACGLISTLELHRRA